jgi:hypothetical protein
MEPFVRVAEVWVPSDDGSMLELSGGLFDAAPRFGAASRGMCFGRAEGLPGHAWDEGRPLLLKRFEGSYFRRTAAARASGLTCAVALPIFAGERLTSVVVLLCGDSDTHAGAIELWRNDPRVASDLQLEDGHFGRTGPALEELTRDSYLSRGAGLPGLAWQREAAVFIDDVGESKHFLRSEAVAGAGVVRGLAFPCSATAHKSWVLCLLASAQAPIARRIECWQPGPERSVLQRTFGFCETAGALPTGTPSERPSAQLGAVGVAASSAVAQAAVSEDDEALRAGLKSVLAIPIVEAGAVREVLALHY